MAVRNSELKSWGIDELKSWGIDEIAKKASYSLQSYSVKNKLQVHQDFATQVQILIRLLAA